MLPKAHCIIGAIFVCGRSAYSSRHAADIRHAMTDSGMPPAARTIAVSRTHEAGRSAWRRSTSPYAWRGRRGRRGAALLGLGISATRAINMFLKQAVSRIPAEVTPQGPQSKCSSEGMGNKARPDCRDLPPQLWLGRPPPQVFCFDGSVSKYLILSAWLKSTTYTRR